MADEEKKKKTKIEDAEYFYDTALTEFRCPNGVDEIGERCFWGCGNLTKVSLVKGIRFIGDGAFSRCNKLSEIETKEGLEEIGKYAFNKCSGLRKVHLVEGIRKIGDLAFAFCTALTHIDIPEGTESIGFGFVKKTALHTITLPLHAIHFHPFSLSGTLDYDGISPTGPPLSTLKTLHLRLPFSATVPTIPFPNILEKDNGQLIRFVEEQQEKYRRSEIQIADTAFYTCFAFKCAQTGLYNAFGGCVLGRIFRYQFRGASLPFPIPVTRTFRARSRF